MLKGFTIISNALLLLGDTRDDFCLTHLFPDRWAMQGNAQVSTNSISLIKCNCSFRQTRNKPIIDLDASTLYQNANLDMCTSFDGAAKHPAECICNSFATLPL